MWLKRLSLLLVAVLVAVACNSGDDGGEDVERGPGAESAVATVDELVRLLAEPDFETASSLAHPDQAALASLAEGATFGEVAAALRDGDAAIAANFWSGFAQGAGEYLTGSITTADGGTFSQDDVEFHTVLVTPGNGAQRAIQTRESDGFRVDLFASFGAGLAPRMVQPVERLLTTQTDDARLILQRLRDTIPSLLVAANQEDLDTDLIQDLVRVVELVTRYR